MSGCRLWEIECWCECEGVLGRWAGRYGVPVEGGGEVMPVWEEAGLAVLGPEASLLGAPVLAEGVQFPLPEAERAGRMDGAGLAGVDWPSCEDDCCCIGGRPAWPG